MLSSDLATLSEAVREKLAEFFTANLAWVERVLEQGRKRGSIFVQWSDGSAGASDIGVSSRGAAACKKTFRDANRFDLIAEGVISALS